MGCNHHPLVGAETDGRGQRQSDAFLPYWDGVWRMTGDEALMEMSAAQHTTAELQLQTLIYANSLKMIL